MRVQRSLTHGYTYEQRQAEDDPKGQSTAVDMLWVCLSKPVRETGLEDAVDGSRDEDHERTNQMNNNHIDILNNAN